MKYTFISYKRRDSKWAANLLYRYLQGEFGTSAIFLDTENIEQGAIWPEKIKNILRSSSIVLLMVGDQFEELFREKWRQIGKQALLDDWVFLELRTAQEKGIRIIPVYLDRKDVNERDLPEEMRALWPGSVQKVDLRISNLQRGLESIKRTLMRSEGFLPLERSYLDTDRIPAPKLWLKCNHSISSIRLGDIWHQHHLTAERVLQNVLAEDFGIHDAKFIQQVNEDSASINFRVDRGPEERAVLLRIHKRLDSPPSVTAIIRLQNIIAEQFRGIGLFTDHLFGLQQVVEGKEGNVQRDVDDDLIQLFSEAERERIKDREQLNFEARYFIDNVRHYPAENPEQIINVAHGLGALNVILHEVHEQLTMIDDLSQFRERLFTLNEDDIARFENNVRGLAERDTEWLRMLSNRRYTEDVFPDLYKKVRWGMVQAPLPETPIVQDFHPHNCFFGFGADANRCVLIYDFEGVGRGWPKQASFTFALHRFTREYKRRFPDERESLHHAVRAFIEGYRRSGAVVPVDSGEELATWIAIINIYKLIALYTEEFVGGKRNPRKPTTIHDEAMKFLSFIEEAEFYRSVDWK